MIFPRLQAQKCGRYNRQKAETTETTEIEKDRIDRKVRNPSASVSLKWSYSLIVTVKYTLVKPKTLFIALSPFPHTLHESCT